VTALWFNPAWSFAAPAVIGRKNAQKCFVLIGQASISMRRVAVVPFSLYVFGVISWLIFFSVRDFRKNECNAERPRE